MPPVQIQCKVLAFRYITPTVFEIDFNCEPDFQFVGGQFISIVIPGAGPNGRDLRRAYSIASAPQDRPIVLCVKLVEGGPGTTYLSKLKPGDVFKSYAPYGHFVYKTADDRRACFVSTGTGVAPFRSMILSDALRNSKLSRITCMLGVREENELLYSDELRALLGPRWIEAVSRPTAAGGWKGFKGRVTDWLRQNAATMAWAETDFYLCGSSAMIDEMKVMLAGYGVKPDAIFQEVYYKVTPGE